MSDARFQELIARARKAWRKACQYDHIPATSLFVAFSTRNPHAERYNELMLALNRAR